MSKSDSDEVPPTEMLPRPDSTFALPKKNVGKATKANKGKDSAADKYDEETTTVKKVPEVKPENVETNGVAAKGKKERGKKAGKKNTVSQVASEVDTPGAQAVECVKREKTKSFGGTCTFFYVDVRGKK
jgi:hypothetical protein